MNNRMSYVIRQERDGNGGVTRTYSHAGFAGNTAIDSPQVIADIEKARVSKVADKICRDYVNDPDNHTLGTFILGRWGRWW